VVFNDAWLSPGSPAVDGVFTSIIVLTLFLFWISMDHYSTTPKGELEQFLPDVWKREDAAEPLADA
jgi:hypothetical protein